MVHCGRCGSGFSAARMRSVFNCPRCLMRSDIASPLIPGPPPAKEAPAASPPLPVDVVSPDNAEMRAQTFRPTG